MVVTGAAPVTLGGAALFAADGCSEGATEAGRGCGVPAPAAAMD